MLFYPTTHGLEDVPSRHENGQGYFLTTDLMRWYLDQYIDAGHHYTSPYFAPCLAGDLSGLPPATIITAEFDPLRDKGARYAEKLRAAGVPVDYRCYPGTIHAFLSFYPVQAKARDALAVAQPQSGPRSAGRWRRRRLASRRPRRRPTGPAAVKGAAGTASEDGGSVARAARIGPTSRRYREAARALKAARRISSARSGHPRRA